MTDSALDLLDAVRELDLPADDYAIFGSGPLIVRRIIEATNDLDLVSRGAAWTKACEVGELVHLAEHNVDVVSLNSGAITIGRSWAYGDIDVDEVIGSAELIDGLPFARLIHVVAYKQAAGRPKDIRHLEALQASGLWKAPDA